MDAVATAKLALDASGMDRGLAAAQGSLQKFARTASATIASGFAFTKIIQGFSTAIEKGDQLQDIAEKFGVSASKLQLLGNAASVFGSGVEQVSAGLNKLSLAQQKALAGDTGLAATFAEVGISVEQLKTMAPEDILLRISDSFASGANEGRQFIIVNELLGKAQTDLIKLLNQGSGAITAQGEALGVLTDEQIAGISELSDQFKILESTISNAFGTLASFINPAIKAFQDFTEEATLLALSLGAVFKGDFALAGDLAKMGAPGAASKRRAAEGMAKTSGTRSANLIVPEEEQKKLVDEKAKQDKALFDEELYNLKEQAKIESDRDTTLFDRMIRDAEFARDEKKRILEIEKSSALQYKEMIERAMDSSGSLLDQIRNAAGRQGRKDIVANIDKERQNLQKITDELLIGKLGQQTGERRFMGMDSRMIQESRISGFAQMESNVQRESNNRLFSQVDAVRQTVHGILDAINARLGVPILRSAY